MYKGIVGATTAATAAAAAAIALTCKGYERLICRVYVYMHAGVFVRAMLWTYEWVGWPALCVV